MDGSERDPWCDEQYEDPTWEPEVSPWDIAKPDPDTLPLGFTDDEWRSVGVDPDAQYGRCETCNQPKIKMDSPGGWFTTCPTCPPQLPGLP